MFEFLPRQFTLSWHSSSAKNHTLKYMISPHCKTSIVHETIYTTTISLYISTMAASKFLTTVLQPGLNLFMWFISTSSWWIRDCTILSFFSSPLIITFSYYSKKVIASGIIRKYFSVEISLFFLRLGEELTFPSDQTKEVLTTFTPKQNLQIRSLHENMITTSPQKALI